MLELEQARRQEGGTGCGGSARTPPPPKNQKGPPDRIVKSLKCYKNNVVVGGLTI